MDSAHETPRDSRKLEGRYSNYFKVDHNAFEFVLDFGQYYSESKEAHLHTRIITSPIYVKSLLGTLQEPIERHEQSFGAIQGGLGKISETQNVQTCLPTGSVLLGGNNSNSIRKQHLKSLIKSRLEEVKNG